MKLKMFRRLAKSAVVALSLAIMFDSINGAISTTHGATVTHEDRSHLFFKENSNGILGDEGYRWRSSLNFSFQAKQIKTYLLSLPLKPISQDKLHNQLAHEVSSLFFPIEIEKQERNDDPIVFYEKRRTFKNEKAVFLRNTSYKGNEASFNSGDEFFLDKASVLEAIDGQTCFVFPNILYQISLTTDGLVEMKCGNEVLLLSDKITLLNNEAKIYKKDSGANFACAAITIVLSSGKAYSKLLQKDGKLIIGTAGRDSRTELSCLGKSYKKASPFNVEAINNLLETNIKGDINDAEAKLIYELLKDDDPKNNTLILNIEELLSITGSKYDDIKLIVLHLHTQMDPCAVCTKIIVGLSRQMNRFKITQNENMKNLLCKILPDQYGSFGNPADLRNNLQSMRCPFLIEVSSERAYVTKNGQSAHAECSGWDDNFFLINSISDKIGHEYKKLAIPYGIGEEKHKNWRVAFSFPPYVIFSRVNGTPEKCATHRAQQH